MLKINALKPLLIHAFFITIISMSMLLTGCDEIIKFFPKGEIQSSKQSNKVTNNNSNQDTMDNQEHKMTQEEFENLGVETIGSDGEIHNTQSSEQSTQNQESQLPKSSYNGLLWAIDCIPGKDCSADIGHPDIDGDGLAVCGGKAGYRHHLGTDIAITNEQMARGVNVLASADGVVLWSYDGKYDKCPSDHPDCHIPPPGAFNVANKHTGGRVCTPMGDYCNKEDFPDSSQCFWCFDGGNFVVIKHDGSIKDREGNKVFATAYHHLKTSSIRVKKGDTVTAGQVIAQVGSAGKSTGAHLHFEVWKDYGKPIDPWIGTCDGSKNDSVWLYNLPYHH